MTASVSISPAPILQFLNNSGQPNAGGTVLTQVGGVNHATYQDSAGATPLPNPIPLNSRGEISNAAGTSCQLFIETGVTYTFTLYDVNGNQLNQATYITPPPIVTQNSAFIENTINTSQSIGLANTNNVYICTAALTLTIAQTSLLNKSWYNTINAFGGNVTITPYAADQINGGTAGASFTIPSGYIGQLYTDGNGNLYVSDYASNGTPTNATNATNVIGSGTVSSTTTGGAGLTPAMHSYLAGCTMSTAGGSATMSIATGVCTNSTNAVLMALSAINKTTSAWTVGSGNGGIDTGSIAAATWYYFYVIRRTDTGAVDAVFSLSSSAPTLPANYTQYRYIGMAYTDGSSHWTQFVQTGREFWYYTPVLNFQDASSSTSAKTVQVLGGGRKMLAILSAGISSTMYISDPDTADLAPSFTAAPGTTIGSGVQGTCRVWTNASGVVRYRSSTNSGNEFMVTLGWVDLADTNL